MFHMYIYIIIPEKDSGGTFFIVVRNNRHKKRPQNGVFSQFLEF